MTDEHRWLLFYGRRWVDWWEFEDDPRMPRFEERRDTLGVPDLIERMHAAGLLESDRKRLRVRLKTKKERNESIRV
jgi:hypothetical protein